MRVEDENIEIKDKVEDRNEGDIEINVFKNKSLINRNKNKNLKEEIENYKEQNNPQVELDVELDIKIKPKINSEKDHPSKQLKQLVSRIDLPESKRKELFEIFEREGIYKYGDFEYLNEEFFERRKDIPSITIIKLKIEIKKIKEEEKELKIEKCYDLKEQLSIKFTHPKQYFKNFLGEKFFGSAPWKKTVNLTRLITAFVGCFVAIALLGILDQYNSERIDSRFILGSMGAAAVLLYATPDVQFAQPRSMILGNIISSAIGVSFRYAFQGTKYKWLSAALSVSISTIAMILTATINPPAGATAMLAIYGDELIMREGFFYIIISVLVGYSMMVVVALFIDNFLTRYPKYWL
eukprot:TRINITY_DN1035_c0_g1_i2.p1 TRINITY_DN1035_c0_g1~~TRINITY_DN1035_c0_g1_i2.p1  ORF type:complete len:352 (-),score=80.97 TRINITY_DN1035_c0_g1_i2:54-1109(-)